MHSILRVVIFGLLPCLIPPYAFKLSRTFGTQRVGWLLFVVFSLLAALQLAHAWHPMGLGIDPGLTLDLLNFLIPVLLLIGMVHIEMLFKERVNMEKKEARLRAALEVEVRERTAELDKTNEELRHEISLRKAGEAELRTSKEQYRFLFDENPQPMWIYNLRSYEFLAFNRAALRHYGFTAEEFRGMTARDLYPTVDVEAFEAESAKASPEIQRRTVCRHLRKDGSIMEAEIIAQDLMCAGNVSRLVLAHDITAQRQLQKEMLQSQKAAVTAQLAGGVADNFSRLIETIDVEAKTLLATCADSDLVEPLKRIAATAGAATALTHQLFALVRRHPMRPRPLDLNKLVEEQTSTLGRLTGNRITIVSDCDADVPPVSADPALVEQILQNLVRNARDSMPEGGSLLLGTAAGRLDEAGARRHEGARPGPYVSLTVSDSGCGMTPEVQSRLFEPFFTTKGPGKATGLGLATVHGLVEQHSGWIEVDSQPGRGSSVTVFFPCAPSAASAAR